MLLRNPRPHTVGHSDYAQLYTTSLAHCHWGPQAGLHPVATEVVPRKLLSQVLEKDTEG